MARLRAQDRNTRGPACNMCMMNPGVPMCRIRDRLTTPEQSYVRLHHPRVQILCYDCLQDIFDERHSVGGKKSFMITLYLLIQRSKAAFQSTYGLQLETSHACAATAIHSGSHVKGDVGDALWLWITCYFTFNELNDFVQNESIEPAWPIHQGNLLCMDRSRWILKMTSLTRTHVYITQSFRKGRGGQPVSCMITLLVILLDMPITFNA